MEIGLIGQPNAGKSALFTKLTGIGAISSNYPGTTVQFQEGSVLRHGMRLNFHDLPGTYSLAGLAEDELVATRLLAEQQLDVVVVVADATRLEQSLVLLFQLIELGFKVVVALNQMDVARKRFFIDIERLEVLLQVPVVPTVAITGEGVEQLVDLLVRQSYLVSDFQVRYEKRLEELIQNLSLDPECKAGDFPKRGALIKLLEGNRFFTEQFSERFQQRVGREALNYRLDQGEDIEVHINRDRYGEAGRLASEVVSNRVPPRNISERFSDASLRPLTGIPILLAVLGGIFFCIVFIGGFLESLLLGAYELVVGDFFQQLSSWIGGEAGVAVANGIDLSIQAILAIVVPYIILFYLILGIMEDSGYLPRVVVLLDGVMHHIGLHGKSVIPMIVGMGCNVPALMATRVLESRREKLILAVVITIAVPCSAQTAIIVGTVGNYSGLVWAVAIYVILLSILLVLGRIMHKVLAFEPTSLAMEIPEMRWPRPYNVLWKTWTRTKDFFVVAFPILLAGSLILEALMAFGVLQALVEPLAPFTEGFLGLPPLIIIALIFGVLRKEMSLQLLVVLFGTVELATVLNPDQMFVFALIMATYMPCLSALAAMSREFGWKDSSIISVASVAVAFMLGGLANAILSLV
jgi:ferrous iron transport protein B